LAQDVSLCERNLQAKRLEFVTLQDTYRTLSDEFELLRIESRYFANGLHDSETDYNMSQEILSDKQRQLQDFIARTDLFRQKLIEENKTTISHGSTKQELQRKLREKEKEHKDIENALRGFQDQLFKDTKQFTELQQNESDLVAEIENTQV